MKKFYAIVFICMAFILGICVFLTFIKSNKIAKTLRYVALFCLLPTLANFVLMISTTQLESNLAYSIFYGSINLILVNLLRYCVSYTGLHPKPKCIPWILLFITIVDSISMFLNPIFGHAFQCNEIVGSNGEIYYLTMGLRAFNLHLLYSYFLSILCFVVLIYKLCKTAPVYWWKYLVALFSLATVLVWDATFVAKNSEVDKSIIGYAIGCCLLTYFTLIHKPRPLINSLMKELVCNSSDSVLFFDTDKNCIFANEPAKVFFDLTSKTLNMSRPKLKQILRNDFFPVDATSYRKFFSTKKDENTVHLKVEFHEISKNKRAEGFFYIIQDCTNEINEQESERYRATHHNLTGLYNKQKLLEKTETLLRENLETQYYVVATDIKNFKLVNDLFGRDMGDKVLIHLANTLNGPDLPNTLVGHINADRFVQIVKEEDLEENLEHFETLFKGASDLLKDRHYNVIVHAGIYKISKNDFSVITMFDRAFLALATVKHSYENRYARYDESIRKTLVWEQQITSELDNALHNRQFQIYLQPQTNRESKIVGTEALVRWNHPEKGLLPPNQFIKTFEKNGQIAQLDFYMWENACQLLAKWKRMGRTDFYISVNLSPLDFYYVDVYQVFTDLIAKYDVSPKNLHLEVTETLMLSDLEVKLPVLERLHVAGFVLVLDDFGSGFSSLNLLKDFPVEVLKLDMEFLYRAKDVERSKIIIQNVVDMAKKLNISVVTEGVETQNQFEFLRESGCDYFQGYYLTQPIPVDEFMEKFFKVDSKN